jgi:predicted aspartyl protease
MSPFLPAAMAAAAFVGGDLCADLVADGDAAVQLRATRVGHLHTTGTLQGRAVEILVDTGASNTVIDVELARELGLRLTPSAQRGAGVGDSSVAVNRVDGAEMVVGGVRISGDIYTMDFTSLRAALGARGVEAPVAVLGGDAMRSLDAVLVYRENLLFLRPRP